MAIIKKIKDFLGNAVYPVTRTKTVSDDTDKTLDTKSEEINIENNIQINEIQERLEYKASDVIENGAIGDGIADDLTIIQNLLNSGASVLLPKNKTFRITGTLIVPVGTSIFGNENSVIKYDGSGNEPVIVCGGTLHDITIDGNTKPNVIGILCDTGHRPYYTKWGKVLVKSCPSHGMKLAPSTSGIAYNKFEWLQFESCGIGLEINPTLTGWVNANTFEILFTQYCNEGIRINNQGIGADGNSFLYFASENGGIGINHMKGVGNHFKDGWLDDNITNISLSSFPDSDNFVYAGHTDTESFPYTYQSNTSHLLTFKSGGQQYNMRGRWWFDMLKGNSDNSTSGIIENAILNGVGSQEKIVQSGTTIDVTNCNFVTLNYTTLTEITNLLRSGDFKGHRSGRNQIVTILALGNAAYMRNNGANLLLSGHWYPSNNDTITLFFDPNNSKWVELSRHYHEESDYSRLPTSGTHFIGRKYYYTPTVGGNIGFVCVTSGTLIPINTTCTADSTDTVIVASTSNLKVGRYISIAGTVKRIRSIKGTSITMDSIVTAGNGLTFVNSPPLFKNFGSID